jgi:integrase
VSPRRASLRVAHQLKCPKSGSTSLNSLKGCRCQPSYYVFQRDRDGRPVKSKRVRDKRTAETMLRDAQRDIDEGRSGLKRQVDIDFNAWAAKYEEIIEDRVRRGDMKPRTQEAYLQTNDRGRKAFGSSYLHEIGPSELRRFDSLGRGNITPASRLRYLRELGACLQAAIDENKGYLDVNPVPPFKKRLGLKKPKRGKAPFELEELPRLYAELAKDENKVYVHAARFSAEAGLRLGELIGLEWTDVSLLDKPMVNVARQYEDNGLTPKSGKARRFRLTKDAAQVLEDWLQVVGPRATGRVFPMSAQVLQDRVEKARENAGIPKLSPDPRMVDEQGKPLKRSLHSLRYSCAALMLNRGYGFEAVMATTGHSRAELTEMYGTQSQNMLDALYDQVENPG